MITPTRPTPATSASEPAPSRRAERILLLRRVVAEAVGTGLLVAIVVGSGIYAQRLSTDAGLQLLENSIATGAGLVALILAFGPVSGAHFNPVVTLADRVLGGITTRDALAYIARPDPRRLPRRGGRQPDVRPRRHQHLHPRPLLRRRCGSARSSPPLGLLLVILGVVRAGKAQMAPFAVGGYIAAAYWFTSSTSFANPAVTIARTLSDTFAGIEPSSVPPFIVAQVIGAAIAVVARPLPAPRPATPTTSSSPTASHERSVRCRPCRT